MENWEAVPVGLRPTWLCLQSGVRPLGLREKCSIGDYSVRWRSLYLLYEWSALLGPHTLNKIIKATLLFLPPFFMS